MKNSHSAAVLVAVFWFALVLGCSESRRNSSQATKPAPVMTVSAQQLASAYKDNEVAADERYKGKVIAVTGIIDSIGKDTLDTPYVVLGGGDRFSITSVQCMFGDEYKSQLAVLS